MDKDYRKEFFTKLEDYYSVNENSYYKKTG